MLNARPSMSDKLVESISICKAKGGEKSFKEPLKKELLTTVKPATAASLAKSQSIIISNMTCV